MRALGSYQLLDVRRGLWDTEWSLVRIRQGPSASWSVDDREGHHLPAIPVHPVRVQPVTGCTPSRRAFCNSRDVSGNLALWPSRSLKFLDSRRHPYPGEQVVAVPVSVSERGVGEVPSPEVRIRQGPQEPGATASGGPVRPRFESGSGGSEATGTTVVRIRQGPSEPTSERGPDDSRRPASTRASHANDFCSPCATTGR